MPAWAMVAISAGSAIYGAIEKHKAANQAAQTLQQGADTGTATQAQALGPYMNNGAGASYTLGSIMGLPTVSGNAGTAAVGASAPPPGFNTNQAAYRAGAEPVAPADQVGTAVPRGSTIGDLSAGATPQTLRQQQTASSYQTVKMQAPDGSTAEIPQPLVQPYVERGAKVVAS